MLDKVTIYPPNKISFYAPPPKSHNQNAHSSMHEKSMDFRKWPIKNVNLIKDWQCDIK